MVRRLGYLALVGVLLLAAAAPVLAEKPGFAPSIYADGVAWGTKVTTLLNAPNGHNNQSYDKLYIITNNPLQTLPVGEAAPGNPMYNGGRWWTHGATWTAAGMAAHDPLPVLMSLDDILFHEGLGHLVITVGSPDDHPNYFSCPLLPVK